jgi:hypothetical protein
LGLGEGGEEEGGQGEAREGHGGGILNSEF